jgi:hypothetical protein
MKPTLMGARFQCWILCTGGALLQAACSAAVPPATPTRVPTPPKVALPIDFVALVDDSGSISPAEQSLLRETTMLLADLAEVGDGVCTIAFGEGARKVASTTIAGDEDRRAFKEAVRTSLRFRESWSDIRAGLKLLADPSSPCFRPTGQSRRVAVVLSDGRLEPRVRDARAREGQAKAALDEMRTLLRGPLGGVDLYAVVLGAGSSKLPIPGLNDPANGLALMRTVVAPTDDHFSHAERLDQLLDVAMSIVGRAKGSGALAEAGTAQVRIDDTVTLLTLVVRKRGTDGARLASSGDIRVVVPGTEQPLTAATRDSGISAYWSADYEYFDLIQVRRPRAGLWKVALANGGAPQVLFQVRSPISLRYEGKSCYFSNESAQLTAFLFDSDSAAVSRDPAGERYRVRAKVLGQGPQEQYLQLEYETAGGQYLLSLPEQVGREKGQTPLELVAEKRKTIGSEQMDPWFIRRTSPFTVRVVAPIVSQEVLPPLLTTIPLPGVSTLVKAWSQKLPWLPRRFGVPLLLASERTAATECAPSFEVPPTVEVEVESAEEGKWKPIHKGSAALSGRTQFPLPFPGIGHFRYRYHVSGTTSEGPFATVGPWHQLAIRRGWEYLMVLAAVLLVLAQWRSSSTARLDGRMSSPKFAPAKIAGRVFDPAHAPSLKAFFADQKPRVVFTIEPVRWFWLRKRVALIVSQGKVTVTGPEPKKTTDVAAVGNKAGRKQWPPGAPVTVTVGTEQFKINVSV